MAGKPPKRRPPPGLQINVGGAGVAGAELTPTTPGSARLVANAGPAFFTPPCTPAEITYATPKLMIPNLFLGGYCTPGFALQELIGAFGFNCTKDVRKNIAGIVYENVEDTFDVNDIFRADILPPELLHQFDQLVNAICKKLQEGQKVYIHCEAGQDRSPFVVAAVLLTRHPERKIAQVIEFLNKQYKSPHTVANHQHKLEQWFEWRKQWTLKPEEMKLHPGLGRCCL